MADDAVIITDETTIEVVEPTVKPDEPAGGDDLLAGKYKTQEDLVAGYKELEKKLGETVNPQPKADTPPTKDPLTIQPAGGDEGDDITAPSTASSLIDSFEESFAETGELSDEQVQELEGKGMSREDAEMILQNRKEKADKYLTDLLEPVGGIEGWEQISEVLVKHMDAETTAEFNQAMTEGNTLVKSLLIKHAQETVQEVEGVEPTGQTTGDTTKVTKKSDVFTTQIEMAQAVGDPRYISDPSYRAEVEEKIKRSDTATMQGFN